jgi:hypothetical protein
MKLIAACIDCICLYLPVCDGEAVFGGGVWRRREMQRGARLGGGASARCGGRRRGYSVGSCAEEVAVCLLRRRR